MWAVLKQEINHLQVDSNEKNEVGREGEYNLQSGTVAIEGYFQIERDVSL